MERDNNFTVVPEPEFDVNVRSTAEMLAVDRGIPDIDFSTYEQEMLVGYVMRDGVKHEFEIPANLLVRQERLEKMLNSRLDEIEEAITE